MTDDAAQQRHRERMQRKRALIDGKESYGVVVLNELNIALKYRYLELDAVLDALLARPSQQHVVVTGRAAPAALIDIADTVSEINMVKHAFSAGIRAQKGVEF